MFPHGVRNLCLLESFTVCDDLARSVHARQESSVEEFGVVHATVKDGQQHDNTVGGRSVKELHDFLRKYDHNMTFAGMRRVGYDNYGTLSGPASRVRRR